VDEHSRNPNDHEEREEEDAFFCKAGGGVLRLEKRAVERTPEKGKIVINERVSVLACDAYAAILSANAFFGAGEFAGEALDYAVSRSAFRIA
jgi:hypothetical protein